MMNTAYIKKQQGFALLYTVVIVSLILSITAGISNVIFKQSLLANLATDSQIAFYQADSAIECGMFLMNNPLSGFDIAAVDPDMPMSCGGTQDYVYDASNSSSTRVIYSPSPSDQNTIGTSPCSSLILDVTDPAKTIIEGHGFNICNAANPRHIERVLQVIY